MIACLLFAFGWETLAAGVPGDLKLLTLNSHVLALAEAIGEPSLLFGHSSGAVIGLESLVARPDHFVGGIVYEPPLVTGARNHKILADAPGHVIVSRGIRLLEVPTGPVDRSMGDVHPLGNPHYSLDPANGKIIATTLTDRFSRLDSANAGYYAANLKKFSERLDKKLGEWTKLLEPYRGTKVVTYHKSFDYLLDHFALELAGTIEPKPGIEPSPGYVNSLIPRLKGEAVKLVIIEPFRPRKTPEYVAQAIGAKLLLVPGSVGGNEKVKDYISLFDYDVAQIAAALKESK